MLRSDRRGSNLIPSPTLLSGESNLIPSRHFFLEDNLFVGSLGSEHLGTGPRTLYWSLTMFHLPSEDSPKAWLS